MEEYEEVQTLERGIKMNMFKVTGEKTTRTVNWQQHYTQPIN